MNEHCPGGDGRITPAGSSFSGSSELIIRPGKSLGPDSVVRKKTATATSRFRIDCDSCPVHQVCSATVTTEDSSAADAANNQAYLKAVNLCQQKPQGWKAVRSVK